MRNRHTPAVTSRSLPALRALEQDGVIASMTDQVQQTAPKPAIPAELRRLASALGRQAARADLRAHRPAG